MVHLFIIVHLVLQVGTLILGILELDMLKFQWIRILLDSGMFTQRMQNYLMKRIPNS